MQKDSDLNIGADGGNLSDGDDGFSGDSAEGELSDLGADHEDIHP